ncbi:MAG TPA: hypothetical protein VN607_06370 [Gemmatimonadaceae bacterium]|nr:hypothetical protein [Gemmatimonadaceae bacterium]
MVPRSYLRGLDANDFAISGIYGIPQPRTPGSWRIVCSDVDGKRHKARLFDNLKQAGQPEDRGALRTRVHELERLYRNAYAGDLVLTTIAVNVLKDSLRSLV